MDPFVDFLTSKTGAFAAVAALVGLVGGVQKIVLPMLKSRRDRAASRASLRMSEVIATNPPPHSEAGEATFQLMNTSGGKAVLRDLHLHVVDHGPVDHPKLVEQAAPVPEFTYLVTLDPAVSEYDVRKKEFGSAPPHQYVAGEVESFRIKLRSTEPQWYSFRFLVRWYDVARPETVHELESPLQRVEFRPDVRDLLGE